MNGRQFDALTQYLAETAPRRRALKALAGAAAGAVLAALNRGEAAAGRRCQTNPDCPPCQYCRADGAQARCHRCAGKAMSCELVALCRRGERCFGEPCTAHTECCGAVCNGLGRCQFGFFNNGSGCATSADCCIGLVCTGGNCVPA